MGNKKNRNKRRTKKGGMKIYTRVYMFYYVYLATIVKCDTTINEMDRSHRQCCH